MQNAEQPIGMHLPQCRESRLSPSQVGDAAEKLSLTICAVGYVKSLFLAIRVVEMYNGRRSALEMEMGSKTPNLPIFSLSAADIQCTEKTQDTGTL